MASRTRPTADSIDPALGAALAGITLPAPSVELTAAFFHRTFARWLGLPEGGLGGATPTPLWDYDFWKAELVDEGELDGNRVFLALVHRGRNDEPERYRYWLRLDPKGRIRASGWFGAAPDLLRDEGETRAFSPAPGHDGARLRSLFTDDGEDPV